ncbi:ABA4-like family protein [Labrys wisconsinensis]|uniref:DUF4281 domain-containing protein n=1 Tax=Labrys wisconsinensis TaxID=425677 RepID=A0ABU0JHL6_9HYPH|nr:ABA4-like family protein [Labrys wisconsinensis]MDQ0473780.1 hypothetical protein [Labrys wisconsinensis]
MLEQSFGIGNMAAMLSWALLVLLPRWRGLAQAVAGVAVPALLSLAYLVLIGVWWSRTAGGFGSIAEVRALFGSDALLVAGWFHYLAFDLFVGAWILREGERAGLPHPALVPLLVLTFLFGPIGYLGFLALRRAWRLADVWPQAGTARRHGLGRLWFAFAGREPVLVAAGLLFLAALLPTGIAHVLDERTLAGVNVWTKPLKFEASLALFAFSLAWFMPMASDAFRRSLAGRAVVWAFVVPAAFEIAYIVWRASRGEASHFNTATPAAAIGYALMGLGAVTLTLTAPLLAWGIARRDAPPADPAYRLAVILGLALTFVLGGIEGMVMSAGAGHAVGAPLAGDAGVPVFGWLRSAGDLRVAHFLGIHAQQAIPLAGALAAALLPARARPAVLGFAALYAGLTIAAFVEAMAGRPLL